MASNDLRALSQRTQPVVGPLNNLAGLSAQAVHYDNHYKAQLDKETEKAKDDPDLQQFKALWKKAHQKIRDEKPRVENFIVYFSRDDKKIPFFGDVSNGKSATLNAMLHAKVLPSRTGHTTDALISISGWDRPGYEIIEGNTRIPVKDISALHGKLRTLGGGGGERAPGDVPLVEIKIPVAQHPLIGTSTMLYDCPGANNTTTFDAALTKYCQDADVIVVVVDAVRRVSESEKNFLYSVKENVATPELFFLANKWDTVPDDEKEENIENFTTDIKAFLQNQLDLMLPDGRIFCVSARKTLEARQSRRKDEYTDQFAVFENALEVFIKQRKEKMAKKHLQKAVESAVAIGTALDQLQDVADHIMRRIENEMKRNQENKFDKEVEKILNRTCDAFGDKLDKKYLEEIVSIKDKIINATRNQMATKQFADSLKDDIESGLKARLSIWMEESQTKFVTEAKNEMTDLLSNCLTTEEQKAFRTEVQNELPVGRIGLEKTKLGWSFSGEGLHRLQESVTKALLAAVSSVADVLLMTTLTTYATRIKIGAAALKVASSVGHAREEQKQKENEASAIASLKEEFNREIEKAMKDQKATNIPRAKEELKSSLDDMREALTRIRCDVIQNTLDGVKAEMTKTRSDMESVRRQVGSVEDSLKKIHL